MALLDFLRLLRMAPRGRLALLLSLVLLTSLTEGIGILLLVPLLGVLQGAGDMAATQPLGDAFGRVMASLGLSLGLESILVLFLALIAARSVILVGRELLSAQLQHRLVDGLRSTCFEALLNSDWRWLSGGRQSDHANLLLTDVNRVGTGFNFGLMLLAGVATLLAYVATAFILSWQMTLIALGSGAVVFMLLAGQRRRALGLGQDLGAANRNLHRLVQESLAGMKLTKILGNETRHAEAFSSVIRDLREKQVGFLKGNSLSRALYQFGGALLLAVFVYLGVSVMALPVAELLVLVLVFSRLIPQFSALQQYYHHWLHATSALFETERMLAECRQRAEPADTRARSVASVEHSICLENASLRYAGREQAALDGLNICFRAHQTTAIMGASGAGKSTLADVLMGLLELDSGRMTVDGRVIAGAERIAWRQAVAYVPQEVFLFNDSIRSNLLWGVDHAQEADLHQALRRAAAQFVFELPDQLDTQVGDGGVRLSGGERQRLALARALLRSPSLLILDEATSALDRNNEASVREAIESLHGDLTVVIIGHRLATLEHADQVVIMDGGRVVSQGPWQVVSAQSAYPRRKAI